MLIEDASEPDEARALLGWTRELADAGLRANALLSTREVAEAVGPVLKEHHAPDTVDVGAAAVYLASDASAAVEGAAVVAER